MFKNDRYMTRGIQENIPLILQLWIWGAIDQLSTSQIDYLQVFEIKVKDRDKNIIEIVHKQEEPEYREVYEFVIKEIEEDMLIFVIDDNTHSTMLLSEEY